MAESLQNLKRRQKGVHNINQITKAMELVAATRMRRSQEIALSSRPYVFAALDLLSRVVRLEDLPLPELLTPRTGTKTAYVVITSDKGLAGSFNSSVLRAFEHYVKREAVMLADPETTLIGVGNKAIAHLEKTSGRPITAFNRFGDYTTIAEVKPLADHMISGYLRGDFDRVVVFSMNFISALRQEVAIRELLPVDFEALRETARQIVPETGKYRDLVAAHDIPLFRATTQDATPDYIIEPDPRTILASLADHLVMMEIYHLVLEANASEHAARRMAMKSASDNAKELGAALSIQYNKSRQAVITRELIEITAGAESLA